MPGPAAGRIEHLVVLMLENRSFDHLLGLRPGVDGLTGREQNLLDPSQPEGPDNPAFPVDGDAPWAVAVGDGPGHSLQATSVQLCGDRAGPGPGRPTTCGGFVQSYASELRHADHVAHPTPAELRLPMQAFAPGRLPSLGALADAFCVCDAWHAEVPGPTQPNRLFAHAGTSFGHALNRWDLRLDGPTVFGLLGAAGRSWATYDFDANEVRAFTEVRGQHGAFRRFEPDFAADVAAGALPSYAFVIPRFLASAKGPVTSQHPPHDLRHGDHLVADVYEALRAHEAVWSRSALLVLHDEHGGFFDHVPPPGVGVPSPDGRTSPQPGDPAWAPPFDFTRLGLRVPAVLASPWVAAGRVDATRYQHTSIIATLRALFGLGGPLGARDAAANPFDHLFGELPAPRGDCPRTLPRAPLDPLPAPGDPAHPARQPLDRTQRELVQGLLARAAAEAPARRLPAAPPATQGEAHALLRTIYATLE